VVLLRRDEPFVFVGREVAIYAPILSHRVASLSPQCVSLTRRGTFHVSVWIPSELQLEGCHALLYHALETDILEWPLLECCASGLARVVSILRRA